jgi:hypothetical protein
MFTYQTMAMAGFWLRIKVIIGLSMVGISTGFRPAQHFFPSDSLGIIVLVNQNGSAVPSVVRNIVSDRMLGVAVTDWNKELKARRDKGHQTTGGRPEGEIFQQSEGDKTLPYFTGVFR